VTTLGATTLNAPTGRTASYVIAASDAPANVKAQADYVCDGTADDVQIQAAIDICTVGGTIYLTEGTFYISNFIVLPNETKPIDIVGAGNSTNLILSADVKAIFATASGTVWRGTISYLKADGDKATRTMGAFFKGAVRYSSFENLYLTNFQDYSLYFSGYGFGGQVDMAGTVTRCTFLNNGEYNISGGAILMDAGGYGTSVSGLNVNNCLLSNNYIGIGGSLNNLNASSNVINGDSNGVTGISGSSGRYINITSNLFGSYVNHLPAIWSVAISLSANADNALNDIVISNNHFDIEDKMFPIIIGASNAAFNINNVLIHDNTITEYADPTGISQAIIETSGAVFNNLQIHNNVYKPYGATNKFNYFWGFYYGASAPTGLYVANNGGYINSGEHQVFSGSLKAGNANAICFAFQNPYKDYNVQKQTAYIVKITIVITTSGGTAGSHLDVGISDDATGTNRGTEFFNDILLNNTGINESLIAPGTQTLLVPIEDSSSATDGWIVGQILDANAANLVGTYYIEIVGK
jgi:hypothetical protein